MTIGSAGNAKHKILSQKTVRVTKPLIEDAKKRNSGHCMIAEAVKVLLPHARHVSVDLQTIRWSDPEKELRYVALTPRVAQVALVKWDQGDMPAPFSFQLRGAIVVNQQQKKKKYKENKQKAAATAATTTKTEYAKAEPQQKKKFSDRNIQPTPSKKPSGTKTTLEVRKNGSAPPPLRVGGRTPPRVGLRRAFGLRGFKV